jgi:predicted MFS family arabinose efflux permease
MAWGMARVGPLHTGKVMAWQGIAIYAALGIGAPIGLAILRAGGFAAVAIVTVALPFAAILIALLLPATAPTPGKRLGFARVIGRILSPGLVLALATTPFVAIAAFIALDFSAQSWGGAGLAMLGFGAGFIVVRLFLAHLPDQLGGAPVAAVSLLIAAAGQISLWSAASPSPAIAGATLTGIGSSLVFPAMGVVAIRRVPPQNRGVAAGAYVAFFDIAIGVGGPLCGIIAGHYGYGSVFLASAVACLFAIALAVAIRPASLGAATPPA